MKAFLQETLRRIGLYKVKKNRVPVEREIVGSNGVRRCYDSNGSLKKIIHKSGKTIVF